MALFAISTHGTFVRLLLAARQLALDPDKRDEPQTLADLAGNLGALHIFLSKHRLTALAREMEARARDAKHFTHDGPAKDDAMRLFWQVAPIALADTAALASADLDARITTDHMLATIAASPHGPDFRRTTLAEPYFRSVLQPLLKMMPSHR